MTTPSPTPPPRPRGRVTRLLDAIGSVPFGVTLMVLILLWCWVGSAGTYPVVWFPRQTFEKTEMEWFSWWPFDALLGLLALSLILVTVRRIRFNLPNLGVWVIHSGVVVLILGGAVYFGSKLEGDMAVYRREALLRLDGGPAVPLVLRDGAETDVRGAGGRTYHVSVAMLNAGYELLTGKDKGKRAYAVQLMVQPVGDPAARPFVRQLLAGYPEYTEDVLPGQGRAIKVLGRKIVDDRFDARLDYAPSNRLFLQDRPAIDLRVMGQRDWTQYPVRGLPRYHEYVSEPGAAWVVRGQPAIPVRPLALEPRAQDAPADLRDVSVRVTGFLPYARLDERWEPGGDEFHPYVEFLVEAGGQQLHRALLANEPGRDRTTLQPGVDARFRWVTSPDEFEALRHPATPRLVARVPGRNVVQSIPLADLVGRAVTLGDSGYALEGLSVEPNWALAGTGESASMALVRVHAPGGRTYLRSVVWPQVDRSQDLDVNGKRLGKLTDDALSLELADMVQPGLWIVSGPGAGGTHALLVNTGANVIDAPLERGRAAAMLNGALHVTLLDVSANAQRIVKPTIIPFEERDTKAGPQYSLVQVEIAKAGGPPRRTWIEYSHYAHPNRIGYAPRLLQLAGMPPIELLYTRESVELPASVALEDFRLETFPGGDRERDFISLVRFKDAGFKDARGNWSDLQEVHSNHPTEHDGWWFFQATWDPPEPSNGYAGMNYTGLGVGNRHGVGIMLLGCLMTVTGTLWAFYVKPVLLRRYVRAKVAARVPGADVAVPLPGTALARTDESGGMAVGAGGQQP